MSSFFPCISSILLLFLNLWCWLMCFSWRVSVEVPQNFWFNLIPLPLYVWFVHLSICGDDSQIYVFEADICVQLPSHVSQSLIAISTWIVNRHLKPNMSKILESSLFRTSCSPHLFHFHYTFHYTPTCSSITPRTILDFFLAFTLYFQSVSKFCQLHIQNKSSAWPLLSTFTAFT